MADCFIFQGRCLNIKRKLLPELFAVEETKSNLYFTAKHVRDLSQQRLGCIRNEIQIISKCNISHPNIISLYRIEETLDSITLLYEYCNNDTIGTYQKVHPLKFFYQICLGINYLHSKSIIHKNLTVNNILVNDNIPKIANLELAGQEELLLDQDDSMNQDIINLIDPL